MVQLLALLKNANNIVIICTSTSTLALCEVRPELRMNLMLNNNGNKLKCNNKKYNIVIEKMEYAIIPVVMINLEV